MNDSYALDLYTKLVVFQRDNARNKVEFDNSDHSKQDVLHSLARKLGLEYEHSLLRRQATISKTSWIDSTKVDFSFRRVGHSALEGDVASPDPGQQSGLVYLETTSRSWLTNLTWLSHQTTWIPKHSVLSECQI